MTRTLSKHTEHLLDLLNDPAYTPRPHAMGTTNSRWHWRYFGMPGMHRDRVVVQSTLVCEGEEPDWSRVQRFVRCFVGRNDGTIFYSGGWDSPAKWGQEFATEFSGQDHEAYAAFTRDRGWGYKGDRAKWEARVAEANA